METKLRGEEWIMDKCCETTLQYGQRELYKWKVEFQAANTGGFCGLSSKTYTCWNEHLVKTSSKGVQKSNCLTPQNYMDVLETQKNHYGVNRGFIARGGAVHSYESARKALSYNYFKREVLEDGVNTKPLDL